MARRRCGIAEVGPILDHMALRQLRVLVYPETGAGWTARALEHDIAAQGSTIERAVDTLLRVTRAHIAYDQRHNREPLSGFAAAPQRYRNAFVQGIQLPPTVDPDPSQSGNLPQIVAAVVLQHPATYRRVPVKWTA